MTFFRPSVRVQAGEPKPLSSLLPLPLVAEEAKPFPLALDAREAEAWQAERRVSVVLVFLALEVVLPALGVERGGVVLPALGVERGVGTGGRVADPK